MSICERLAEMERALAELGQRIVELEGVVGDDGKPVDTKAEERAYAAFKASLISPHGTFVKVKEEAKKVKKRKKPRKIVQATSIFSSTELHDDWKQEANVIECKSLSGDNAKNLYYAGFRDGKPRWFLGVKRAARVLGKDVDALMKKLRKTQIPGGCEAPHAVPLSFLVKSEEK